MMNGFLFASLGLVESNESDCFGLSNFLLFALPLIGIGVALAGFCGIGAAHLQMRYLTRQWNTFHKKLKDKPGNEPWVRPFGDTKVVFLLGALTCYIPLLLLFIVWILAFYS